MHSRADEVPLSKGNLGKRQGGLEPACSCEGEQSGSIPVCSDFPGLLHLDSEKLPELLCQSCRDRITDKLYSSALNIFLERDFFFFINFCRPILPLNCRLLGR